MIKSGLKTEKTLYYNESIAKLDLKYKINTIYSEMIGADIQKITLLPGEVKTFLSEINDQAVIQFANENTEALDPGKKTLFQRHRYLPVTAVIVINTKEKVLARIHFNYMVE